MMILDYLIQYLDLGIFFAFLLLNLTVGLIYSRSVTDLRDYALGGKNFSTPVLVATIVATLASGNSLFVILENTYSKGLYFIIARLGLPVGLLLYGQLATRMAEFLNNVSVAEAMRDMYGKTVQVITAVCGTLAGMGTVAVQFKVMAKMLFIIFGLENTAATFLAAVIVIAYSSLGGIRAVTFTDMLQFFTFGTVLPILALTIWNKIQDPAQVTAALDNNPLFNVKEVIGFHSEFMATLGLFLFFAIPGINPSNFQRIAMARDTKQLRQAFTHSAGILLLIFLLIAWLSILLLADNPTLSSKQVVPYLISHHTYTGLRGLLGIGVMALAMSTADSHLNACAVLFANDLVGPLTGATKNPVRTARLFSLISGVAALLMAFYNRDLLQLILLSASLYKPIYSIPLLMAILGFRTTPRVVLISMAAGFTTVVLWSIYFDNSGSVVPGMLANLVALLGSHYLLREKGG